MVRVFAAAVFTTATFAPIAEAVAKIAPQLFLETQDQADLQRIEDSLNAIQSLHSAFQQKSSNGEIAEGNLYLSRPGRMRIEYKPPVPILVVANGTFLIYYDKRLGQVSYVPLGSTPADILLDKYISLSDRQLTITSFERIDNTIRLGVVRTEDSGEGSITLIFNAKTLQLGQWAVIDAQGVVTVVTLIDPRFNVSLDPKLFQFDDPRQRPPEYPSGK